MPDAGAVTPAQAPATSSLVRKLLSTGGLRLLIVPLSALSSIVGNGLVMHSVGLRAFGVVSLVISLPNLVPFMDLGLGTSLINAYASRDLAAARRQTHVAWSMLWLVALTLFVACTLVQLTVGWGPVLGVDLGRFHDWGLLVFFATTFAAVPLGIGQRILTGLDRVPLVTTLAAIAPAVNLPLLWLGSRTATPEVFLFAASAGAVSVAAAMLTAATRAAGLRLRDWTRFTLGTPQMRREIATAAGPMVVITAGLPLAFETHRLVLARLAPGDLGYYSMGMVLYAPVLGIAVQMAANLWPYFSRVRSTRGERAGLGQFWRLQRYAVLGALLYVTGFAVCAPFVNRVWAHRDLPTSLWIALAGLMLVQVVQYVPGMYLTSAEGLRFQARCIVAMCLLTLALMLVLTARLGALGPVVSSILGVLLAQLVPEWLLIRRQTRAAHRPRRALPE